MLDKSQSFYFFDIDDNLLFLPTKIYLWNAETKAERAVDSGQFAAIQNLLGREGEWLPWSVASGTFRDFRDDPAKPIDEQSFLVELTEAVASDRKWMGPSWPLLVHAAKKGRAIAMITARGHDPGTIEAGIDYMVSKGLLESKPPILGIYPVSNPSVRAMLGAYDPAMTTPSVKKLAIRDAVEKAISIYGSEWPHRFGMSDDDPNNVVLAISAMRDCKEAHPGKRFFVINSNHAEYVKLEIFPMLHPVTCEAENKPVLSDDQVGNNSLSNGGNASIYVSDMERAISFYTDKLGLFLKVRVGTEWAEIDAGNGLVLGLHRARPPETVAAGTIGAINIELAARGDLASAVTELKTKGVEFKGEIVEYPAVHIATILDPDANEILLVQVLDSGQGA